MHLYATGFNAWGQLNFGLVPEQAGTNEPQDLQNFTKVLEATAIERPVSRLSYTIVRQDGILHAWGGGFDDLKDNLGLLHSVVQSAAGSVLQKSQIGGHKSGVVLQKYPSIAEAARQSAAVASWPYEVPVTQIVAYDAGFVILLEDGTVETVGDPRFEDCLGRQVSVECPAEQPGRVGDLASINDSVVHVTAGGYTVAALTEGGSIYAWGRPGFTSRGSHFLPNLDGVPNYIEVDDGQDIQDVALGESHAICLATDGSIYVIGDNASCQLGMHSDAKPALETWTKAKFQLPEGHKAVAVAAGAKTSFILTAKS